MPTHYFIGNISLFYNGLESIKFINVFLKLKFLCLVNTAIENHVKNLELLLKNDT